MQREILIIAATVITLGTVLSAPSKPDVRPAITLSETNMELSHQQFITNLPYICTQPNTLLVDFGHTIDANGNFAPAQENTASITL